MGRAAQQARGSRADTRTKSTRPSIVERRFIWVDGQNEITLVYTRQTATSGTLSKPLAQAKRANLSDKIKAMLCGDKIYLTKNRRLLAHRR